MSPDLDPALDEATARAIWENDSQPVDGTWDVTSEADREWYRSTARVLLAAAAPLIRAQERAAVRAELLALARDYDLNDDDRPAAVLRVAAMRVAPVSHFVADRIAPEPTPKEKP